MDLCGSHAHRLFSFTYLASVTNKSKLARAFHTLKHTDRNGNLITKFDRHVLETLREPLEAGRITISRAALQADFPAACQLIAAEPLSVQLAWGSERSLPMHAGNRRALFAQTLGAAAGPHRHTDRASRAHAGRTLRALEQQRAERRHLRAGERSARPATGPSGQDQPRTEWPRSRRGLSTRCVRRSAIARSRRALRLVGARLLPGAEGSAHDCGSGWGRRADRRSNCRSRPISSRIRRWMEQKNRCQDLTYAHESISGEFAGN